MDKRRAVKRRENHVHFPIDAPQQRRHGESERAVPRPVRRGREGDGLGADAGGEDFRGIGPGSGTPGDGEGADEEIGERDDGFGDGRVADEGPGDGAEVWVCVRGAIDAFERADDEEEGHHAEGAEEEGGAAAPAVEVEDCGEGEGNVEDVLD